MQFLLSVQFRSKMHIVKRRNSIHFCFFPGLKHIKDEWNARYFHRAESTTVVSLVSMYERNLALMMPTGYLTCSNDQPLHSTTSKMYLSTFFHYITLRHSLQYSPPSTWISPNISFFVSSLNSIRVYFSHAHTLHLNIKTLLIWSPSYYLIKTTYIL